MLFKNNSAWCMSKIILNIVYIHFNFWQTILCISKVYLNACVWCGIHWIDVKMSKLHLDGKRAGIPSTRTSPALKLVPVNVGHYQTNLLEVYGTLDLWSKGYTHIQDIAWCLLYYREASAFHKQLSVSHQPAPCSFLDYINSKDYIDLHINDTISLVILYEISNYINELYKSINDDVFL